jgi:aspartate aminotransferase
MISHSVFENLAKASWIRRMFEEGARLKRERGADKIFDFALGNPEIEPPPAVLAAARQTLENKERHRHAYMPNAGHGPVRAAIAERLGAATGLPPAQAPLSTCCSSRSWIPATRSSLLRRSSSTISITSKTMVESSWWFRRARISSPTSRSSNGDHAEDEGHSRQLTK